MNVRPLLARGWLVLGFGLFALPSFGPAQDIGQAKTITSDRVVAGGASNFMEVRHIVLKGTNEEIGQALATIAKARYRLKPEGSSDPLRTRVQRRFLEKNYPILHDRVRGVAAAFGKRVDDDTWDFSGLPYLTDLPGGCSVAYYPPGVTVDGNGVVSRNYDFSTGNLLGTRPARGKLPATARPYLIEMHPERGYASLAICAYDLLSGVIDGINSEGLTVTMLADNELEEIAKMEPAYEGGVGLGVQQVLRMLLDCCATTDQAKEALLMTKQYYEFIPVHYLVADRHGNAFVWEYSHAHNREYIIEDPKRPLISTNFSLHRHMEGDRPPSAQKSEKICARYCELAKRIAGESGKLTVDFIKQNHQAVAVAAPAAFFGGQSPVRTLWHSLYFPQQRKMQVSFYLGDEPDPEQPGKTRILRSDYLEFLLNTGQHTSVHNTSKK